MNIIASTSFDPRIKILELWLPNFIKVIVELYC